MYIKGKGHNVPIRQDLTRTYITKATTQRAQTPFKRLNNESILVSKLFMTNFAFYNF